MRKIFLAIVLASLAGSAPSDEVSKQHAEFEHNLKFLEDLNEGVDD